LRRLGYFLTEWRRQTEVYRTFLGHSGTFTRSGANTLWPVRSVCRV